MFTWNDEFPTNKEFSKILKSDYNKSRIQDLLKDSLGKRQSSWYRYILSCTQLYRFSRWKRNYRITLLSCRSRHNDAFHLFTTQNTWSWENSGHRFWGHCCLCPICIRYFAHKLPGLRIYKNALENNYVDCENLCSSEMADVIIQLHVLTGCDSNSAFFGHGKKKIFDVVKSSEEARTLLKSCGRSLDITKSTIDNLTKFILRHVCNDRQSNNPTKARVKKWKSFKKKTSLARLPPDEDSLFYQIKRGNYLSFIQLKVFIEWSSNSNWKWVEIG